MGEIADAMINGDDCEGCGQYLGDGHGYPRRCYACRPRKKNEGPLIGMPTGMFDVIRRHTQPGPVPHPQVVPRVQNPRYPSKKAKGRAKKERRRLRDEAAAKAQG
ncbi:MAG: hypothetical protein ACEQSH_00470 [Bacteroidia bacterium]